MSNDEIFAKLKEILVSEFEIDEADITKDALLRDDLSINPCNTRMISALLGQKIDNKPHAMRCTLQPYVHAPPCLSRLNAKII